mmetsp:Transcript_33003/g.60483  ORF Transcript_33003/g.60483 Transcript_33003/m.60483 type:complete len:277 (-) Transcript_33003:146-976(-)
MAEVSHLKVAQDEQDANTPITTTAGGTSAGSPGCPSLQSQGDALEGCTKTASRWIEEMQPRLPPTHQFKGAAHGAGCRRRWLQKLQPVASTAQLRIPLPQPMLELTSPPEGRADTTQAPQKVDLTDVLTHGPLQQRKKGFAGLFWSWHSCHVVLKSRVCSVYATEQDWLDQKEPLEVLEVANLFACDHDFDVAGKCTFALLDKWGHEVAVFGCCDTIARREFAPFRTSRTQVESDNFFNIAAKRTWVYVWKQARRACQQRDVVGTGFHDEQAHWPR